GGVLVAAPRGDGPLTFGTPTAQTLPGPGTIRGSVSVSANSIVSPGDANGTTATLIVTNAYSVSGTNFMELNRTNAVKNDEIISFSASASSATLIVTNLGPDLVTRDTFHLFSGPVSGAFTTIILPTNNAASTITYVWTNKLAIDGTIQVLSGATAVNPVPTNITFVSSGGTLTLSWPPDHLGWELQSNS